MASRAPPYHDGRMQHAVEAPGFKLAVVGGLTLALALGASASTRTHVRAHESHRAVHRLALHAPVAPEAIYLTAWSMGDVYITRDDADPTPIVFETRAVLADGCEWLGTETLTPVDDDTYRYVYDETILACAPGHEPGYIKTPRTGIAIVEE